MTQLTNKTIFLTGATGGFGQHFMRQLLSRGCRLILTDVDESHLTAVAATLRAEAEGGEIVACIGGDLSSRSGVDDLWAAVAALDAPIDVLINNAGIAVVGQHDEVPPEAWERLMQVNLLSPMRLCALVAPQMIARRSGHIVNISSLAGWMASPGLSSYAASKFGLRGFSETLADELRRHNVRVSAVYPFFSDTPILNSPRYGMMGKQDPFDRFDRRIITDPAKVVANVLTAVEKDVMPIFPDRTARTLYRFKRYVPSLFNIFSRRLT